VRTYALGRFMLPVPNGMQISGAFFKINRITILEIPWKNEMDRSEFFDSLWEPVRDAARENYEESADVGSATQGGLAEEDISDLCGHKAMLLCYADSMADHYIDVHVALPEIVLRLKEARFYDIGSECLNMEGNILKLLKHFRFGGKDVNPDSFFSVSGRFEGMKTWHEQANISAYGLENATVSGMSLALNTHLYDRATTPPKSFMAAIGVAKNFGITIQFLRSQHRELAGMNGLEEIFIMSETKNGKVRSELTARWTFEGVGKNHDMPRMDIELTCHPNDRDYALRAWDAVMRNFTTVREYYGRKL
jgi:hypothetical protein